MNAFSLKKNNKNICLSRNLFIKYSIRIELKEYYFCELTGADKMFDRVLLEAWLIKKYGN